MCKSFKVWEPLAWVLLWGKHGEFGAGAAQLDINGRVSPFLDSFAFITDSRDVMGKNLLIKQQWVWREWQEKQHEKYFWNAAPTHFQRGRAQTVRVGDQKREQGWIFLQESILSDAAESRFRTNY